LVSNSDNALIVLAPTNPFSLFNHCSIIGQTIDIAHIGQIIDVSYIDQTIDVSHIGQTIDIAHIDQTIDVSHIERFNAHVGARWAMLPENEINLARSYK